VCEGKSCRVKAPKPSLTKRLVMLALLFPWSIFALLVPIADKLAHCLGVCLGF
jgi:hypothetical protein